jgi:NTP pyrophosphatase (non-canonical NTP hydrolase)
MDIAQLQEAARLGVAKLGTPYRSGAEVVLAITEELGEVATEVALLGRVGSKSGWQKDPSVERLSEEMTHLLNNIFALANLFKIDLGEVYARKFREE